MATAPMSRRSLHRSLEQLQALCPDTHLTLYHRWHDVITDAHGDAGDDLRWECVEDIADAIARLEDDA